jgi:hypothetical protein
MKKLLATVAATTLATGIALAAAVPAHAGIVIYDKANYGTSLGDFGRGTTYVGTKANDKASSLRVSAPAKYAILWQHRDHTGKYSQQFGIGTPNLAGWNFDNITSSIE